MTGNDSEFWKNVLFERIEKGQVLIVVGTRITIGATNNAPTASWVGFLEDGLERCEHLTESFSDRDRWADHVRQNINSKDVSKLVVAAEEIANKLGYPQGGHFRRWLNDAIGTLDNKIVKPGVIHALHELRLPMATTNYDGLIEKETGLRPVTWMDHSMVQQVVRGNDQNHIIHLHGYWEQPESVVLGTRSFDVLIDNKSAQFIQEVITWTKTLLFIEFGGRLSDPNFEALRGWMRPIFAQAFYYHFRLALNGEVEELQSQHHPDEHVIVLGYGEKHEDLEPFLLRELVPLRSQPGRLPPKPALCIGRDTQVNDLVETLLSDHPKPTPILGGPGLGKTTVSLSALYDPKVKERYNDRRYFVRCEVASSRSALVQAIAKEIEVSPSGSDLEPRVRAKLERAPAVLVLDGAETPWLADKDDVEDFLATLSQIPGLALVASFQGLTRPGKVHWGKTISVDEPLELADAREVFLSEAGRMEFCQDPSLDPLLEAVGRGPLAVVQIAKVAQSYKKSLEAVLSKWRNNQLPLPDLDASLSSSIESLPRRTDGKGMTDKEKEAPLRLLQLLGVLPNGIAREELNAILPPDRGYAAETILLGAALAFENKNRLLLRAPVREYVARHHDHQPGPDDLERLIKHFVTMANTYGSWLGTWKGAEAIEKLGDEITNLEAILLAGLELPDPTPSIDVAVDVAAVILHSGLGTTKVLEQARDKAEERGDVLRQAQCIRRMGDVMQLRCEYPKAREYYQMAFDIYMRRNKIVYMAFCKKSMGDTELLITNYSAASDYFREAKRLYAAAKDKAGEANSTKSLGDIERELGHYDEAERLYEEAFLLYHETNNVLGQANCIKGKGDNKLAHHGPEAARVFFEQARPLYDAVGDILGKANCTKGLADIERELRHYAEAKELYDEAFENFGQLKNELCQANCKKGKGDLATDRGDFHAARQDYVKALQLYRKVKSESGEANCSKSLADLELKSRQFEKAASYYERAMELYNKFGNIIMKASCIKGLGDVALGRSNTAEAIRKYQEALPLYQQEKDTFGEACCQRSLGDVELALEPPNCNTAKRYYESAVALFRNKMKSPGELALCLLSLADVESRLSAPQEVVHAHLSEAEALKHSEAMGDQ